MEGAECDKKHGRGQGSPWRGEGVYLHLLHTCPGHPAHTRSHRHSSPCATHMGKRMRPSSVCVRGSSWSIECGKEGAEWRQRGGKGEEAALQLLLLLLLPLRWSLPRETSPRESRGTDQPYVYIYPSLLDRPPMPFQSHLSKSLQSTELSFLCYTATSH